MTPGHQYNRETGRFSNVGRGLLGTAATMGAGWLGGPLASAYVKNKMANWADRGGQPDTSGLGSTPYTPYNPSLNAPNLNPQIGGNYGVSGSGPFGGGSAYSPSNPTIGAPSMNVNTGGGYQVSQAPGLGNAQYTPPPTPALNAPNLNPSIESGPGPSGGGLAPSPGPGGGFTGNSSGGTLGGGTSVDPSQWGQFGFGGGTNPGRGFMGQLISQYGGMTSDRGAGGGNPVGFPAAGNTGIVPPHMATTGGGLPPLARARIGSLRKRPVIPPALLTG
jgi:hypothetical protein